MHPRIPPSPPSARPTNSTPRSSTTPRHTPPRRRPSSPNSRRTSTTTASAAWAPRSSGAPTTRRTPSPSPRAALPTKSAHGLFGTPLGAWADVVALRARGVRWVSLDPARFVTTSADGCVTRGPVVLWITVPPGTAAASVRDATPDVLRVLEDEQITDVVVEWCEGEVVRLVDTARR